MAVLFGPGISMTTPQAKHLFDADSDVANARHHLLPGATWRGLSRPFAYHKPVTLAAFVPDG